MAKQRSSLSAGPRAAILSSVYSYRHGGVHDNMRGARTARRPDTSRLSLSQPQQEAVVATARSISERWWRQSIVGEYLSWLVGHGFALRDGRTWIL